jgi:hypothetical protein
MVLANDSDWARIDGDVCKVVRFTPLARVEGAKVIHKNSTTPYALIALEHPDLPQDTIGAITHEVDFRHLWAAFEGRGINDDEEVVVAWNKKRLRGLRKLFSAFMPGLAVMVCKSGAHKLLTNQQYKPQLRGKARFLAEMPLVQWPSG